MKRYTGVIASAVLASTMLIAGPAQAVPLLFTVTGDYNASFQLDSNPMPTDFFFFGFSLRRIPGTFEGTVQPTASLTFFSSSFASGGLQLTATDGPNLLNDNGPQLYSGPTSNPMFAPGTFTLINNNGGSNSLLTISGISGTVPEPATWALMICGFGGIGLAMRRRNFNVRVSYV